MMFLIRPIFVAKELGPGKDFPLDVNQRMHARKAKNRLRSILDHGDSRVDITTFSTADHASQHSANIQKPVMRRENVSSKHRHLEVDSCM